MLLRMNEKYIGNYRDLDFTEERNTEVLDTEYDYLFIHREKKTGYHRRASVSSDNKCHGSESTLVHKY